MHNITYSTLTPVLTFFTLNFVGCGHPSSHPHTVGTAIRFLNWNPSSHTNSTSSDSYFNARQQLHFGSCVPISNRKTIQHEMCKPNRILLMKNTDIVGSMNFIITDFCKEYNSSSLL